MYILPQTLFTNAIRILIRNGLYEKKELIFRVPSHDMKAYRGSRSKAPLILNIGARWR